MCIPGYHASTVPVLILCIRLKRTCQHSRGKRNDHSGESVTMGKSITELMAQNKPLVLFFLSQSMSSTSSAFVCQPNLLVLNWDVPELTSLSQVDAMRTELAPVFSQSPVVGSGQFHDVRNRSLSPGCMFRSNFRVSVISDWIDVIVYGCRGIVQQTSPLHWFL